MVKKMGWSQNALNKVIHRHSDGKTPLKVIGVVKDFYFENLNNKIAPFIFMKGTNQRYLNIKYSDNKESIALKGIQEKLNEHGAILPPQINFVSETIKEKYSSENDFIKLFKLFTIIAICISIIGIIGLTSYKVQRQLKDVAIKKVLGASLYTVFSSYTVRILNLFAISIAIGLPLVYYFLSKWLNNYANRIDISILDLIYSALLIFIVIIIATILSLRSVIYVNAVKLLKEE